MTDSLDEIRRSIDSMSEEMAARNRDRVEQIVTGRIGSLVDKSATYANLIVLAGYAGAFTLWSGTRETMPLKLNASIAIALGISLFTFVAYEVYKMVLSTRSFLEYRSVLKLELQPKIFLKEHAKFEHDAAKGSILQIWVWVPFLAISVVAALVGVGLLFYGNFEVLFAAPIPSLSK
jgi:hypothetical protein